MGRVDSMSDGRAAARIWRLLVVAISLMSAVAYGGNGTDENVVASQPPATPAQTMTWETFHTACDVWECIVTSLENIVTYGNENPNGIDYFQTLSVANAIEQGSSNGGPLSELLNDARTLKELLTKGTEYIKDMRVPRDVIRRNIEAGQNFVQPNNMESMNMFLNKIMPELLEALCAKPDLRLRIQLMNVMNWEQLNSPESSQMLSALTNHYEQPFPSIGTPWTASQLVDEAGKTLNLLSGDLGWIYVRLLELSGIFDRFIDNNPDTFGVSYNNQDLYLRRFRSGFSSWCRLFGLLSSRESILSDLKKSLELLPLFESLLDVPGVMMTTIQRVAVFIQFVTSQYALSKSEKEQIESELQEMTILFQTWNGVTTGLSPNVNEDPIIVEHKKYFVENIYTRPSMVHLPAMYYYAELKLFDEVAQNISDFMQMSERRRRHRFLIGRRRLQWRSPKVDKLLVSIRNLHADSERIYTEMNYCIGESNSYPTKAETIPQGMYKKLSHKLRLRCRNLALKFTALKFMLVESSKTLHDEGYTLLMSHAETLLWYALKAALPMVTEALKSTHSTANSFYEAKARFEDAISKMASIPLPSSDILHTDCYRQLDAAHNHILSRREDLNIILQHLSLSELEIVGLRRLYRRMLDMSETYAGFEQVDIFTSFVEKSSSIHRILLLDVSMQRIRDLVEQFDAAVLAEQPNITHVAETLKQCQQKSGGAAASGATQVGDTAAGSSMDALARRLAQVFHKKGTRARH